MQKDKDFKDKPNRVFGAFIIFLFAIAALFFAVVAFIKGVIDFIFKL